MRYYIIAGEASGDLHGSNLMKGLVAEDRHAEFRFWGGDLMLSVGGTLVRHYRHGAVMGFWEVLKKASSISANISFCQEDILFWKPDVVILIDYPGFNLRIAEFAHNAGFKVFYYIAPKVWASRPGRLKKLRKSVDKLFIVFPFEIAYFEKHDIPFVYKGNPLIDAVDGYAYSRPTTSEEPYIAVLAGSRKTEITRMMPVCMAMADRMNCRVIVAGAPARSADDYIPHIGGRKNVELVFGRTYDVLRYARAAVINSGTASLEAALIGTPQVVGWSTSALSIFIAKHILRVGKRIKYISLGNLIVDRSVFKELIQNDLHTEALCSELKRLMNDEAYRAEMMGGYADIRAALGSRGASSAVARAMLDELRPESID